MAARAADRARRPRRLEPGDGVVREHLNRRGIGLHNDPQSEISIVGNFPTVILAHEFGSPEQKRQFLEPALRREVGLAFGLAEPDHGSDATRLETTAVRDGEGWVLTGRSGSTRACTGPATTWSSRAPPASPASRSGSPPSSSPRDPRAQRRLLLVDLAHRPRRGDAPRRPGRRRRDPRRARPRPVAGAAVRAREPIRQAASSLGAAQYCVDEAAAWARERSVGGRPLWRNQGIQLPLAEPWTDRELVRGLVRRTAAELDRNHHLEVSHLVAMANYRANRLACDAADRAMQACGGIGYTRRMPFEHIYRHHRRYRITEGTEEVQLRKVAYELFKP